MITFGTGLPAPQLTRQTNEEGLMISSKGVSLHWDPRCPEAPQLKQETEADPDAKFDPPAPLLGPGGGGRL